MLLRKKKEKMIDSRKLILALRAKRTVLNDRLEDWEVRQMQEGKQCRK